jgi:hypothetical protein
LFLGDNTIDKTNNNTVVSTNNTNNNIVATTTQLIITNNNNNNYGLLYYCGMKSTKHIGELKRISYPTLQLLRWLITYEVIIEELERGNFFYTRFVQLPLSKLKLIDIPKHIIAYNSQSKKSIFSSSSNNNNNKSSSNDDSCFVLLTIILNDYRTPEGKSNSIEVDDLLNYNDICHKKYDEWQDANKTNEVDIYNIFIEMHVYICMCE